MYASSGDVETDDIDARSGIRIKDRLPQSASSVIAGGGHYEGRIQCRQYNIVSVATDIRHGVRDIVGCKRGAFIQPGKGSVDRIRSVVVDDRECVSGR